MTDADDDQLQTAEAFATVGNERRLSILTELWRAEQPVRFSELRASVGMRDSAQFNYHLQKLMPRFVRKTDEGYRLAWPGKYVVRAIIAGTLVGDQVAAFETGSACIDCHSSLVASYDGDRLSIRCSACERLYSTWPFPPGAIVDRDPEALLDAYNQWVRHEFSLGISGVCADCGGSVTRELQVDPSTESPFCYMSDLQRQHDTKLSTQPPSEHVPADAGGEHSSPARVRFRCQRCRKQAIAHPGMVLLDDPAVSDLYRESDESLSELRYWTLPWAVDDSVVTVLDSNPPKVEVTVSTDGAAVTATIDESLTVVDRHRADVN
jgi:hypothetical protein